MAAATTTTTTVAVSKTPPRRLGDFTEVFDTFAKLKADFNFKLDLYRKLSAEEKNKIEAKEKAAVKKELLQPHMRRITAPLRFEPEPFRLLDDSEFQELARKYGPVNSDPVGSLDHMGPPLIDTAESAVSDSPSYASDSTSKTVSVDSCHYSTAATTPAIFEPSTTTGPTIVFDNAFSALVRGDKGVGRQNGATLRNGVALQNVVADYAVPTTPVTALKSNGLMTPVHLVHSEYSRVVYDDYAAAAPAPAGPTPVCTVVLPWATHHLRCELLKSQPYEGVYMYGVKKPVNYDGIVPHYMCHKEEKKSILELKLGTTLMADEALKKTMPVASKPIHIFVDLSNITIGFYDALKIKHGLRANKKMKAPAFSFEHLSFVLERGRAVGKKIVAGSLVNTYNRRWPKYMQEAKNLGYEMNILQRVPKTDKKMQGRGTCEAEWAASGPESGCEDAFVGHLKQGEQGVDELLHLKMLQSALDSEPGTIVLATGDAAEAEYSDGFKKNVERLLQLGWNVEIIGWSKGMSLAWRDPQFVQTWGDRFRVIQLDLFTEELFAAWFGAAGC